MVRTPIERVSKIISSLFLAVLLPFPGPAHADPGAAPPARMMSADAGELEQAGGPLTDKMAVWLAARYVVAARKLASCEPEGEPDWKRLRELCDDLVALRRGDHCAEQLRLERERLAKANEEKDLRALKLVIEETKQWPDVQQAYDHAFTLYRQRKRGEPPSDSARPDQTESNQEVNDMGDRNGTSFANCDFIS